MWTVIDFYAFPNSAISHTLTGEVSGKRYSILVSISALKYHYLLCLSRFEVSQNPVYHLCRNEGSFVALAEGKFT